MNDELLDPLSILTKKSYGCRIVHNSSFIIQILRGPIFKMVVF
jgi:hypothetical protein